MSWKKILLGVLAGLFAIAIAGFLFRSAILGRVIEAFVSPYLGENRPDYTHKRGDQFEEWVEMDDGVRLKTRVYLPKGKGPWPVVLVRDPYDFNKYLFCRFLVQYGYGCVHQDVRGRFESGGEWYPFINEASDGEATLNWLVRQDWQDGNLAMTGFSYLAISQWAVADRLPPEVKTIMPMLGHGDVYDLVYRGGHFNHGIAGVWLAGLFQSPFAQDKTVERWKTEIVSRRPAKDADPLLFGDAWPAYKDYISNPRREGEYWQRPAYRHLRNVHRKVDVPVFWVAGWHDFFLEGTLARFPELPSADRSVLFIQPGDHAGGVGALSIEDKSAHFFSAMLDWLDHHLRGNTLPDYLNTGVFYYQQGADRWDRAASWPPVTQGVSLKLAQLEGAVTCDGALRTGDQLDAQKEAPATFRYNPENPQPSNGGSYMLMENVAPTAVALQGASACNRSDVLSFLSSPFTAETRLAGEIGVDLRIASDADDTAFFVRVSEAFEDGRVLNIRDDIVSVSAFAGDGFEQAYAPGRPFDLAFELVPTDWTLAPGSRIRLDISSSNHPAFAAHYNQAGLWSDHDEPVVAMQTVYGGSITLPVVDE